MSNHHIKIPSQVRSQPYTEVGLCSTTCTKFSPRRFWEAENCANCEKSSLVMRVQYSRVTLVS